MDFRLLIARRYLVSRRQVSLISVITGISVAGVAVGVAALVVVLSVMNGFYDFVRDMLVSVDPHVRIVSVDEGGIPGARADSLLQLARSLPHVESATPYAEGKALLLLEGAAANQVVIVRGVDAPPPASEGVEGPGYGAFDLTRQAGEPGVVVGRALADGLGLVAEGGGLEGSQIGLLSAPALERSLTTAFGAPQPLPFEVRGYYEVGTAADESRVFVALPEAQRLLRMQGEVSGVELRLDDIDRADQVKRRLEERLGGEGFSVLTWYDLQRSLYSVMQLEKWAAYLILILIVVVAAFNIVGALTMVVVEKRSDVGVLQAMGVSPKGIRDIFLIEGLLIGVLGAGTGLAVGLGLALLQKYYGLVPLANAESFMLDAYPVSIRLFDLILIVSVSLGLCILAALYPAARAAAIEPARAVQME